jgi:eukaryotic-like serine/threonine-protein kinase
MSDEPLAGRTVAGWRLLRLIGQGAHGSVYLAEGAGHAEPVALKLITIDASGGLPRARQAFLDSAEVARQLHHPGIVRLHAAGVEGHTGWLAMEAVPGTDLGRYTQPPRLLPEPLVLRLAQRLALALDCAHRLGVVHRDLKPANVLVHFPSDTMKLADFGLARAADAAQTGTGIVLGTPAYMAPEQLAGNVPTPQSDLYALGVMLFQLLSGRLPHDASNMGELLRQVARAPAPDLRLLVPAIRPGLAALVARLLAKRPAQRPADARELAAALEALSADSPPDAG